MQFNKFLTKNRFALCAIIIIALLATMIGVSSIFAKPTLENYVHDIGGFKPSGKYDDGSEIKLVAWLNTTQLMFSYDLWEDINKDGVIDANDVYAQEGFEFDTLMTNALYPIFKTEEDANYYVVSLPDYEDYNGVVAQLQIAANNDLAQMKGEETYLFDRENGYLYIDRELIDADISEDDFVSIRAEVIMLFEDIGDATKEVNIYTLFDHEIKDTMGLENDVPNEPHDINIRDWLVGSLQYQLMPSEYFMYASDECLAVYVNGEETYDWHYNAFNGTITIACDPYTTRDVVVKFNEVSDQSDVIEDAHKNINVFSEDELNMFLSYIQYDTQGPEIGDTYELDFTAFTYVDNTDDQTNISALYMNDKKSIPTNAIEDTVEDSLNESILVGECFKTATLSATNKNYYQDEDEIVYVYGDILDNALFYRSVRDKNKLEAAVDVAKQDLLSAINGAGVSTNKSLTSNWKSYREDDNGDATIQGVYIAGTLATDENGQVADFLGGRMASDSGYAFFDLSCSYINAPSAAAYEANSGFAPGAKYKANATIVDIEENGDGGFLYLCVWSESDDPNASQVLLGFSKVPYKYKNLGKVRIYKTDAMEDDETGEFIAGAQYMICREDGTEVFEEPFDTYIENTGDGAVSYYESPELNIGTYYIKEVKSVPGYLKDEEKHEIQIVSGTTQILNIKTEHQKYTVSITVRDAVTNGPIENVVFKLYDPGDMLVGTYETDENGLLRDELGNGQISVNAMVVYEDDIPNSTYTLRQVDAIENYAMDEHCVIEIDAEPTDDGNITLSDRIHNEYRQEVVIVSHVQDVNLGENTKALVGGSYGGAVVTSGAQYQLFAEKPITLSNGEVVSDGPLTILTWGEDGNEEHTDTAYSKWDQDDGKAYIMAKGIRFNGSDWPLPNGEYYWKLVQPSSGYFNDKSTKDIDATWNENDTQRELHIDYVSVVQTRQRASIQAYIKSYSSGEVSVPTMHTNLRDNDVSRIIPVYEVYGKSNWSDFSDSSVKKTIWSSGTYANDSTTEVATLTVKNNKYKVDNYEVVASKTVEGAIYELINLCHIVDIKTGKEIPAGTSLGYYESNEDGYMNIIAFDSNKMVSGDVSHSSVLNLDTISLVDDLPRERQCSLPNGVYALALVVAPDGYRTEVGFSEDIIFDTEWTGNDETRDYGDVQEDANAYSVLLLYKDDVGSKNLQKMQIAPDPKETDSSKITTDWVETNMYNRAYRVVDMNNKSSDGSSYDVSDPLPTNFAFCLNNKMAVESAEKFTDGSHEYQYMLSFYYEVNDYDEDSGYDMKLSDGTCIRRFKTATLSGGEHLDNVIQLDTSADGYKNYGSEILENQVIFGSIHNAEWINKKLADNTYGGKYNIYVFVDISLTYETKGTGQKITVDLGREYDVLTIKSRQLINLD